MKGFLKLGVSVLSLLLFTVVTAGANQITIGWDANTEPDIAGYLVSYGTASGKYGPKVDVGASTSWTLMNPVAGQTYYFTVQAYNKDGLRSAPAIEISEKVPAIGDPNLPKAPPFGVVDTPIDGANGVAGSIAVSGWALDERGVNNVSIYRDPVAPEPPGAPIFLGQAVLIEGARPDVAAAFPTMPNKTRAGWGLLVLTNMLPNRGNGTFVLRAVATDTDSTQTLLGVRTITCTNDLSSSPFGALDTPAQGATVSGSSYANFGWVLSPGARRADGAGGGTVNVIIDGVPVGTPAGWTNRADLTALFPSTDYSGVNSALAVYTIDTTKLSNGIHTIAWGVTDNQPSPEGAGIGSRYFRVSNGSSSGVSARASSAMASRTISQTAEVHAEAVDAQPTDLRTEIAFAARQPATVLARRGFSLKTPFRRFGPDADGIVTISGEEMDRFEVKLAPGEHLSGHVRSGDTIMPLPIGSRLDAATGVFTWQPGVGFVGTYDLVFVRWVAGTAVAAQDIRFVLNPKSSGRVGPQVVIDVPTEQQEVGQPFVVAGWAVDLDSESGNGVDALHVWAYPVSGAEPIFLGAADRGGIRPDVAELHGARFLDAGYGLIVKDLAAGDYNLAVFAWSTPAGGWAPARTVRVTVR